MMLLGTVNWDTVETTMTSTFGGAVALGMFWWAFGWVKKNVSRTSVDSTLSKTWVRISIDTFFELVAFFGILYYGLFAIPSHRLVYLTSFLFFVIMRLFNIVQNVASIHARFWSGNVGAKPFFGRVYFVLLQIALTAVSLSIGLFYGLGWNHH